MAKFERLFLGYDSSPRIYPLKPVYGPWMEVVECLDCKGQGCVYCDFKGELLRVPSEETMKQLEWRKGFDKKE